MWINDALFWGEYIDFFVCKITLFRSIYRYNRPVNFQYYTKKGCQSYRLTTLSLYGAENETRTRDPNLGKVMLYQLSYFRKLNFVIQKSERWVPRTGLEPACLSTHAPETCASTNSATWAKLSSIISKKQERKTRLELATLTLARLCSTNWAISAFHFHKLWRGGDSNSHNISVTTTSK